MKSEMTISHLGKVINVIHSCTTAEQLRSAWRYTYMWAKKHSTQEMLHHLVHFHINYVAKKIGIRNQNVSDFDNSEPRIIL